jgi:glutamine amidotransferase
VVSEPRGDLKGAGLEVPESTCLIVEEGRAVVVPFAPDLTTA